MCTGPRPCRDTRPSAVCACRSRSPQEDAHAPEAGGRHGGRLPECIARASAGKTSGWHQARESHRMHASTVEALPFSRNGLPAAPESSHCHASSAGVAGRPPFAPFRPACSLQVFGDRHGHDACGRRGEAVSNWRTSAEAVAHFASAGQPVRRRGSVSATARLFTNSRSAGSASAAHNGLPMAQGQLRANSKPG